MVAERMTRADHFGSGGVGGKGAHSKLDTRLIAAVQSRVGGARVHEAANLLQAYYGWGEELAFACATADADSAADAERAFRAAAVRLRRVLYSHSSTAQVLA